MKQNIAEKNQKDLSSNKLLWMHPEEDEEKLEKIVEEFNIHPVTAQVLLSRGFKEFDDIHHFLYAKLPNLHDPQLVSDMDKAVERVHFALKKKETILICGDNDVDGITGTALLIDFLSAAGAQVLFYVPNRNALKKSVLFDALDYANKHSCKLLITVDFGITAASEIEEIVRQNIDVIITDHHEPTDRIPHCIATLNPKLLNSVYPNRELTGVGVAFKLAHALTNFLVSKGEMRASDIDLKRFLDLVALGTIADMGALRGENRIFVRYGLKQIAQTKRIGLTKLLEECELKPHEISTADIASKVAPRVNSLGRISDPAKGVELLLIHNDAIAKDLAKELEKNNLERQKIERKDTEDVESFIHQHPEILEHRAFVLYSKKWHPGIIPIIAARIAKQYNRPTIIIALDQGVGKGSARTIPEFPLLPTLRTSNDILMNFGGHDYAAGLMIKEENIEAFRTHFIQIANETLSDKDIIPKLYLDSAVGFNQLTFDFLESLSLLEPFGTENPAPILYAEVRQAWPPKVVGKIHLKLYLEQNDRMLEGIAFGMADRRNKLLKKNLRLKIAFTPQVNIFLNKSSIQLQIKDFHILDS